MMADQPPPQTPPRQVEPATLPPVVSLTEAAHLDPTQARALLGTKAASLARLAGAGFPVPPGVVVVTAAAAADWDQAYARLRSAAGELGGPERRFAVRSSASAEDLAGASFAGQYETVLDVRLDQLPNAVRQVVDSAATARVAAYRQAHPQAAPANSSGSGAGMAVLVQVMVPADAAGVAFTANPLTGDRDEVVITAVRGLGERLVAGQAKGGFVLYGPYTFTLEPRPAGGRVAVVGVCINQSRTRRHDARTDAPGRRNDTPYVRLSYTVTRQENRWLVTAYSGRPASSCPA
jgi:pyruvate,water dikinase